MTRPLPDTKPLSALNDLIHAIAYAAGCLPHFHDVILLHVHSNLLDKFTLNELTCEDERIRELGGLQTASVRMGQRLDEANRSPITDSIFDLLT